MSDLIRRAEAIKALDCNITVTGYENAKTVSELISRFIARLKALPSAHQWRTGCPDESGEYIVMIKGARRSTFLLYDEERDIWHDEVGNFYTVTHWMPLPDPPEVKK